MLWLTRLVGSCRETVVSFVENVPSELSNTDLDMALVRFVPWYKEQCPKYRGVLDKYELLLDREHVKRAFDARQITR